MTAFKVTSRVVTVAFPHGAPDTTGEKGFTIAPRFVRYIHNPGSDPYVEFTGPKRREDGTLTAPVFTDSLPAGSVPEWLDAVLDLALLGENQ